MKDKDPYIHIVVHISFPLESLLNISPEASFELSSAYIKLLLNGFLKVTLKFV